jgi:hypothetical protein
LRYGKVNKQMIDNLKWTSLAVLLAGFIIGCNREENERPSAISPKPASGARPARGAKQSGAPQPPPLAPPK